MGHMGSAYDIDRLYLYHTVYFFSSSLASISKNLTTLHKSFQKREGEHDDDDLILVRVFDIEHAIGRPLSMFVPVPGEIEGGVKARERDRHPEKTGW